MFIAFFSLFLSKISLRPLRRIIIEAIIPVIKIEQLTFTKSDRIVVKRKIVKRIPPVIKQALALLSRELQIICFPSFACCASNSSRERNEVLSLSLPQQGQSVDSLKITLVKQCGQHSIGMISLLLVFQFMLYCNILRKTYYCLLFQVANINFFHT